MDRESIKFQGQVKVANDFIEKLKKVGYNPEEILNISYTIYVLGQNHYNKNSIKKNETIEVIEK